MHLCYVAYSPLDLQSANSIQTFNTLRELSARLGSNLSVLVPRFGNETLPPFPVKRLARIPLNKVSRLKPSAWYSYIERTLYAERAQRFIKSLAPNLIYTRDIVCAYRFVRAGLPVLYEVHDLESRHPGQARSPRLQIWLERVDEATLRGVRGVVSLTETFRHELISRGWQNPSHIFVIPDGYDDAIYFPRDRKEARARLQVPQDAKIITYAGLTFKYRGVDVLLWALQQWNEPDARLVLVGGRDFEVQELHALANELRVQEKIVWVGRQPPDQTALYLAAADALVIPDTVTDATASPLKMFEYMAMARPIVCVDRASLREILGDAALYFSRGDIHALADALRHATDPAALARAQRARARAAPYTYAERAKKIIHAAETISA